MTTLWSVKYSIMSAVRDRTPVAAKNALKPLYHLCRKPVVAVSYRYRVATRPAYSKPGATPRYFTFNGEEYRYFYHPYNLTWRNERTLEIPIAWKMVQEAGAENTLEVGNVLSHYFDTSHEVVDKYEKARGVINKDIVEFHPRRSYDLVVCISTLEHVGFDKPPRDTGKALVTFKRMTDMLNPGGAILVTLPVWWNMDVVGLAVDGRIPFTELHGFERISRDNRWVEVDPRTAAQHTMEGPYSINAVLIGIHRDDS